MVESLLFIEAGAGEKILRAGASQKWTGSATLNLYRTGMCKKKKIAKVLSDTWCSCVVLGTGTYVNTKLVKLGLKNHHYSQFHWLIPTCQV